MNSEIKIVGIAGSLRRGSYNKAALRAAIDLLPDGASLEILDLADLPFFDEDLEAAGPVPAVERFKSKLAEADALLIATPEYNYSLPPALKNALDWASRGQQTPLAGKPVAIMSASIGRFGGARVQYHLRQVCVALKLQALTSPEVFISEAHEKFDAEGRLTDERTKNSLKKLLQALVDQTRKMKQYN